MPWRDDNVQGVRKKKITVDCIYFSTLFFHSYKYFAMNKKTDEILNGTFHSFIRKNWLDLLPNSLLVINTGKEMRKMIGWKTVEGKKNKSRKKKLI